jgi:hypothetical protein
MAEKKTHIVYYEPACGCATLFAQEKTAIAAAKECSKQRGYQCEAVFCGKEHATRNGKSAGVGWHVRGKAFH